MNVGATFTKGPWSPKKQAMTTRKKRPTETSRAARASHGEKRISCTEKESGRPLASWPSKRGERQSTPSAANETMRTIAAP